MNDILGECKDVQRFIEDLISFIRDVLLYQESPELIMVESTGLTDEDFAKMSKAAPATALYQMIDELNNIQEEMRFTTHPDVYLEVLTVKLSQVDGQANVQPAPQANETTSTVDQNTQQTIEQLQATVKSLQATVKKLQSAPAASTRPAKQPSQPRVQQRKVEVKLSQINPVLGKATRRDLVEIQGLWQELLSKLSVPQRSLLHVSKPVAASEDGVIVAFDYAFLFQQAMDDSELLASIEQGLQELTGNERHVVFVPKDKWPQIRREYIKEHGLDKHQPQQSPRPASQQPVQSATSESEQPPLPPEPGEPVGEPPTSAESGPTDTVSKAQELFGSEIVKVEDN